MDLFIQAAQVDERVGGNKHLLHGKIAFWMEGSTETLTPATSSAGCQRPVGLSRGKAKVCYYSGWYYCQSCHQDNSFLIPARLLHNWDTSKHKVLKQTHINCKKEIAMLKELLDHKYLSLPTWLI